MFSFDEVKAASVKMVKARKALDEYEAIHGYAPSAEHAKLVKNFNRAAESYLLMSNTLSLDDFVRGKPEPHSLTFPKQKISA